jgi:predicted tellurium resistance membrane protein TerC
MEADVIGLFLLLVGLELVLGVDNILVIAILVARLPEAKRNFARNLGLTLAMGFRILMVIGGLKLIELTDPILPNGPEWFAYSFRDLALLSGGLFLIWKAVTEIHSTVELDIEESSKGAIAPFTQIIIQIVVLDMVFSLDSVITAVGLTSNRLVIISAVIISFGVILFFAKPIGDFILAHVSIKILALAFLIVIGVTIFMEGMGKHVDKKLIYMPMGFAMTVQFLQMRYQRNKEKVVCKPQ